MRNDGFEVDGDGMLEELDSEPEVDVGLGNRHRHHPVVVETQ